jgi:hypothetical protein
MVDPANNKLPLEPFILLEEVLEDPAVDANVNVNDADGMVIRRDAEVIYGPELPVVFTDALKLPVK